MSDNYFSNIDKVGYFFYFFLLIAQITIPAMRLAKGIRSPHMIPYITIAVVVTIIVSTLRDLAGITTDDVSSCFPVSTIVLTVFTKSLLLRPAT